MSSQHDVVPQSPSKRDINVVATDVDVPKVLANNCEGAMFSQHEVVSQSPYKSFVVVVDMQHT